MTSIIKFSLSLQIMNVFRDIHYKANLKQVPLSVHFDLTYRCHQRCVHCYLPESWRRGEGPAPELGTLQVMSILDQLAAAGTFFLTFSGGEIFLRPDLFDILRYARKHNFSLSLMTSGSLGPDTEGVAALRDIGIEAVFVSLYSPEPSVHDRFTGVPGSWSKTWRTIQECRARGILVVVNCSATTANFSKIAALKHLTEQEGIPLRLDPRLSARWDASPHPANLILPPEKVEQIYAEWDPQEREKGGLTVPPEHDYNGCGAGLSVGYLSPQGEVWPCIELPYVCGRLDQRQDFAAIWEDSAVLRRMRELQRGFVPPEVRPCDFLREKCKSHQYQS
jgi:AdoMet-dependent heme synthase